MRPVPRSFSRLIGVATAGVVLVMAIAAWTRPLVDPSRRDESTPAPAKGNVLRGRMSVLHHGCGDCHGGFANPAASGFLAGVMSPFQEFKIGPCYVKPDEKPCFTTRPRNLTPDNTTGLGRFSERQIFNAMRFGLRPGETPDVEITATTPGKGNFPEHPKYLAPPMPWMSWRFMSDQELWDIAAYLKRGLKPVVNKVEDSDGPPDFWASEYAKPEYGTYPAAAFPTANERKP
jgi:mono/diheme cytochrome c family protein